MAQATPIEQFTFSEARRWPVAGDWQAERVCSSSTLRTEKDRLRKTLLVNGYTDKDLGGLYSIDKVKLNTSDKPRRRGCIPYLPGLSEKVRRVFKRFRRFL